MESVNLALRSVLDMAAPGAVAFWGWNTGHGPMRCVTAIGAVAGIVAVWLLFVSPDPVTEFARPIRLVFELAVWTSAAAALHATGRAILAVALVITAFASGLANYLST